MPVVASVKSSTSASSSTCGPLLRPAMGQFIPRDPSVARMGNAYELPSARTSWGSRSISSTFRTSTSLMVPKISLRRGGACQ